MARWQSLPIAGGSYADESRPFSTQDTVNYLVEKAERNGTRSSAKLRGVPGLSTFCITGSNAPVRGARDVEGRLLVVSGTTLYKVSVLGAATAIGTIPGIGRVSMSHNQITGGNEVAIANGQIGYVYNTVTDTLTQITDEGFPGSISFEYLDSYIMGVEPGRRFGFHSNLAAASDYNTLDRYEAEGSPDRLVGQIVTHREWWLCGERTIEPFADTGASTGTFQRQAGLVIERGVASAHCLSLLDNSVFWVGDDGIVYRANGYTPQRISTMPVEQALAQCDLSQCFSFTFEDEGHKVYYLTCPDGYTSGFDVASGEWHWRQSKGLKRWRINTLTKWNGVWIAGDYSNGRLYQLDWNIQEEAGEELERRRVMGALHDNNNALIVNAFALTVDTGAASVTRTSSLLLAPLSVTGDLVNGPNGDVVSYQYVVGGGVLPVTVSITSGALPAGLSISSSGLVTGTRTTLGNYAWTVRATDADGTTLDLADESVTWQLEEWNPSDKTGFAVLSNGNRTLSTTADNNQQVVRAKNAYSTGKFYYETVFAHSGSLFNESVGIQVLTGSIPTNGPGQTLSGAGYGYVQSALKVTSNTFTSYGSGFIGNDVVMVAVDLDAGKLWFGKNGAWYASGNPETGLNPSFTITAGSYAPCINVYHVNTPGTSNFAPSDFVYDPPSGFKAWGEP